MTVGSHDIAGCLGFPAVTIYKSLVTVEFEVQNALMDGYAGDLTLHRNTRCCKNDTGLVTRFSAIVLCCVKTVLSL